MALPVDKALVWRDGTANLTATETLSNKKIASGTDEKGMVLGIRIPSQAGTSPTLDIKLRAKKASGGAVVVDAALPQVVGTDTFPMLLLVPFKSRFEFYDVVLTVGGTSPNFGGVEVWVEGPGYESKDLETIA
jgi:hypothetical protein